jgi:hypothetical protein
MGASLKFAGIYNILFGIWVIGWPSAWFELSGMEVPRYPFLWQCIGMIVGVYGVGYLAAASAPLRHWPIVLVGFLGKVFGPIGFVWAASQGELPLASRLDDYPQRSRLACALCYDFVGCRLFNGRPSSGWCPDGSGPGRAVI